MEEEALFVLPEENERKVVGKWKEFVGEMKKVGSIATPMVVVTVSQYLLQVVSMSMAGHLGEISLSSTAIATSFTNYSSSVKRTRTSFSRDVFLSIGEFIRFAVPSAIMVCLEWWSFELFILLSGLSPNPELETSVLSICLTTATLHFYIPYLFGAAASTRVSNELGAGNPDAAQLAVWAVITLDAVEVTIASATLFCCRHILGRAISNDMKVVNYVTDMAPLLCISIIMDSFQAVLSGNGKFRNSQPFLIVCSREVLKFQTTSFPAFALLGIKKWVVRCGDISEESLSLLNQNYNPTFANDTSAYCTPYVCIISRAVEGDAKAVVVCRGRSTAVEVGLEDHEAARKAAGAGRADRRGGGHVVVVVVEEGHSNRDAGDVAAAEAVGRRNPVAVVAGEDRKGPVAVAVGEDRKGPVAVMGDF
ncbi:hypothetical protein RHGRI_028816 [Rhododendron griersonianum]|uniref:MATE efflux family protein n=1 Tax=Rhododendron griersonianum TaxID=479676 RepID=A0AAV6IJ53_9ERIC|nr:hypothetical protein RHGRI_028816 [Rhododendron griersonianum]